jgi:hypothetical protein
LLNLVGAILLVINFLWTHAYPSVGINARIGTDRALWVVGNLEERASVRFLFTTSRSGLHLFHGHHGSILLAD